MRFCLKPLALFLLLAFGCTTINQNKSEEALFDSARPVMVYASSQADYRVELELQEIDSYFTAFKVRTTNTAEACKDSMSGILHLADTVTGNAEIREDDFSETVFAESLTNENADCGFGLERDIEGGYRIWLNVYDCPANLAGCRFDADSKVLYKQGERLDDHMAIGFMPASRTRLFTEADLAAFPDWALLRNEIFARYGHPFQSDRYKLIFGQGSDWYQPRDSSIKAEDLNGIEHKNVVFLQNLEAEGYSGFRSYLAGLTIALTENDQLAISKMIAPQLQEEVKFVFPDDGIEAFQNNEYRVRWNRESKQKELIIGDEDGGQLQYYFDKVFAPSGQGRWILTQMLAAG